MMSGTHTVNYADGGLYNGELKDGKRHGQGISKYANGNRYAGEFKDDERNGRGTSPISTSIEIGS